MTRAVSPSQSRVVLGWLGVVFVCMLPLVASTADMPATTGMVCVALAVLAFAYLGDICLPLSTGPLLQRAVGSGDTEHHCGGQVTDPPHHPLQPRAPGLV